jgi:hypothetical protein
MKTVTIQIGNSDDKLTQLEWSNFVDMVDKAICGFRGVPHFAGGSATEKPWQNYCFVFELDEDPLITKSFQRQLKDLRAQYKQDSVAWVEGITLFV